MFHSKTLYSVTGMAVLLGSTAIADVTSQEVWEDFQENMAVYGDVGVTIGNEAINGDTLTVTDIVMTVVDAEEGMTVEAVLPSISFTDQGDGTVLVTMAESYPFTVTDESEWSDEPSVFSASLNHTGLELVVSGTPEELTYDLTADTYGMQLDSLSEYGEDIPITAKLTMNGMTGTYVVRPGELREVEYVINAETTDVVVEYNEPEYEAAFNLSGQIAALNLVADMILPEGLDTSDPENIDFTGMAINAGYTFGEMAYVFDFQDGSDAADGSAQADGGSLDLVFNETEVAYNTSVQAMNVDLNIGGFPFPVSVALAEYGINFAMPLSRTDEPAPFEVGINVDALSVNDEIWMMGDPSGQLPHEPITAQIGISGTAKWLFDLLDPAQQADLARSDMPVEPYSVQIDTLNVDALGVQVTGDGAFTFDNSDLTTIPGFPRPEGSVTVNASGVNALMDTLVGMGLVPQEEIMGVRMMMGIFATSTGDDQLTSTLEINSEGHVIANGQRLQ